MGKTVFNLHSTMVRLKENAKEELKKLREAYLHSTMVRLKV
ncbi:MAG: hypothetical protein ACRCZ2_08800 [Fusobacteriaceae bacterium]